MEIDLEAWKKSAPRVLFTAVCSHLRVLLLGSVRLSRQIHGDFRNRGRLLLLGALDEARPPPPRARAASRRHGSDHRSRRGSARRRRKTAAGGASGRDFVPDEAAWREELAEFIRRRGDHFMSC